MAEIIRLDVQKNTFRKYIIKTGFNYNIRQYEDFIFSIKNILINKIKTSIIEGNTRETQKEIFGNEVVQLDILFNYSLLIKFKLSYLKKLISEGSLDLFFIEETRQKTFSVLIQEKAYFYNSILNSNLTDEKKETFLEYLEFNKNKSSNEYISMLNCLNNNGITLSEEIKSFIYEDVNKDYKRMLLRKTKKSYIHRLFSIIQIFQNKEMSYYSEDDMDKFISLFMKGDYLSLDDGDYFLSLDYGNSFGIIFYDSKDISKIINLVHILRTRYRIYNEFLVNLFSAIVFDDMKRLPISILSHKDFNKSLNIEENLNIVGVNDRYFDMYKEISSLSYKNINDIVVDIGNKEFTVKEILNSYS